MRRRECHADLLKKKDSEALFDADRQLSAADIDIDQLLALGSGAERRSRTTVEARTGRFRRSVPIAPGEINFDLALPATLKRAVLRQTFQTPQPASDSECKLRASAPIPNILPEDLCKKLRVRPCDNLIVLTVDTSDSMGDGAEVRMRAAKGAALAILRKAYQNRSRVALVAFGGEMARTVLPPTRSIGHAQKRLQSLTAGGATPFASGLFEAWQIIRHERLKNPQIRPVLLIVSDGEANVPMTAGMPPWRELMQLAETICKDNIAAALIDVVNEHRKSNEMRHLANLLKASYIRVADLKPHDILDAVNRIRQ